MNEIVSLLRIVRNINITDSSGCPDVNNVVTMNMGGSGDCVVPLNLEKAVKKLHYILFNVDDYTPSNSVKRYSNRITELRVKYTEENRVSESLKESSQLESILNLTSGSISKSSSSKKVASDSNTKQTDPIPVSAPNDLNIVDADSVAEEPESDESETTKSVNTAPTNSSNNTNTAVQQSPNNDGIVVYDSPGVPRNNTDNGSNSVSNTPPSSNFEGTGGGVVVSGPPGSQSSNSISSNSPSNNSPSNQVNIIETAPIVPIITAPY